MTRTFTEPRPPFGPERCQSNVGYQIKQHEHIVHLKEKIKREEKKRKKKKKEINQIMDRHSSFLVTKEHC